MKKENAPTLDAEEEESLKELYQELDLKRLVLISVDATNKNYQEMQSTFPPYGGVISELTNLNKQMTYFDMLERVCKELDLTVDEIRLWDQVRYEQLLAKEFDAFDSGKFRDYVPKPIQLEHNEIIFPLFLTDHILVAEKIVPQPQKFPESGAGRELTRAEWWKALVDEDWAGKEPALNHVTYDQIEIIKMERNTRNNSLFNALGYLFHILSNVKGEEEADENIEGLTQVSKYRAPKIRKEIARFVTDNWEEVEKSGMLSMTVDKYVEKVLDPSYSGSGVDLTLTALMKGAEVQVFDIAKKKMVQYGRGYVERYGFPGRPSHKFAVKLVRWANGFYDPITFSMQPGLDPDRQEEPFCLSYVKIAFDWMERKTIKDEEEMRPCANCYRVESISDRHDVCSACRLVFYCGKRCQILHWRNGHQGICQKRDFAKESAQSLMEETSALSDIMVELEKRRRGEIGIRKLRKKGAGFVGNGNGFTKLKESEGQKDKFEFSPYNRRK